MVILGDYQGIAAVALLEWMPWMSRYLWCKAPVQIKASGVVLHRNGGARCAVCLGKYLAFHLVETKFCQEKFGVRFMSAHLIIGGAFVLTTYNFSLLSEKTINHSYTGTSRIFRLM